MDLIKIAKNTSTQDIPKYFKNIIEKSELNLKIEEQKTIIKFLQKTKKKN